MIYILIILDIILHLYTIYKMRHKEEAKSIKGKKKYIGENGYIPVDLDVRKKGIKLNGRE